MRQQAKKNEEKNEMNRTFGMIEHSDIYIDTDMNILRYIYS